MKKEDFNIEDLIVAESLEDSIATYNDAYLVCFTRDNDFILSEIHQGDCYVGGDEDVFINDSNIEFEDIEQAEWYYKREYTGYYVFYDENDRDEFLSKNGLSS